MTPDVLSASGTSLQHPPPPALDGYPSLLPTSVSIHVFFGLHSKLGSESLKFSENSLNSRQYSTTEYFHWIFSVVLYSSKFREFPLNLRAFHWFKIKSVYLSWLIWIFEMIENFLSITEISCNRVVVRAEHFKLLKKSFFMYIITP